ncbi:uncharacterized protein LOC141535658 [Cotesia typhae]|uniref:uncharacterized protein LOC141535658 n=1 Tax=Cotesia typhae TaxID=2053667 RepID=UPI003D682146
MFPITSQYWSSDLIPSQDWTSYPLEYKERWPKLHVAVWYGFYTVVEGILRSGTPADSAFDGVVGRGFTPLHLAALKNQLKCAEVLLEYGASVSPQTGAVCDPINIAVFKNHQKMVILLLSHGSDVNSRFSDGFFKLFYHELSRDWWMGHGLTLLHCSTLLRNEEMTQIILNSGADIYLKTRLGKSSLMQAVEVDNVNLVKYLVEKGVGVNDRDSFGQPVLHYVVHNAMKKECIYSESYTDELMKKKMEIVKYLVYAGADVNAKFTESLPRSTVLHYMMLYRFSAGVQYMLDRSDLDWNHVDLEIVTLGDAMFDEVHPIFYSQNFLRHVKQGYAYVMYLIAHWSVSRHALGLPVCNIPARQLLQNKEFQNLYADKLLTYQQVVKTFVKDLQNVKVSKTDISFYYLLTCENKELINLTANKAVRTLNGGGSEFEQKFSNPLGDMLLRRVYWAHKKRTLRKKAVEIVFDLFSGALDYDCCYFILRFVKDRDLIRMVSSASKIN